MGTAALTGKHAVSGPLLTLSINICYICNFSALLPQKVPLFNFGNDSQMFTIKLSTHVFSHISFILQATLQQTGSMRAQRERSGVPTPNIRL